MKIQSDSITNKITLPYSKSVANRLIILASLDDQEIEINHIPNSDDVQNLLQCLKSVGLDIQIKDKQKIIIANSFPKCEKADCKLNIGEGGTSLHFLLPLLSLGTKEYQVKMGTTLAKRPHQDLLQALNFLGVKIEQKLDIITVQGPIQNKEVNVDCSKSSQYASALKLIAHKANLNIELKNLKSSKSFYDLTMKTIENFQKQNEIPIDMASLSYPLVYGLLNQEIEVLNTNEIDFNQPDAKIFSLFKECIKSVDDHLAIIPLKTKDPFNMDMSDCLDMIPTMSFLASYLDGESTITGIKNLIYKESDRLKWIQYLLEVFEVSYKVQDDSLFITGRKPVAEIKELNLPEDHRIVMTAYLFLKQNGGGSLNQKNAVKKSFPDFFDQLEK